MSDPRRRPVGHGPVQTDQPAEQQPWDIALYQQADPANFPLLNVFHQQLVGGPLAARLAGVAGEGQIVAGPETVGRLGDRYRLERLGRERLKNISHAIDLFRILG